MFKKLSHIIIRHEFHRDYLLNKSLETIYYIKRITFRFSVNSFVRQEEISLFFFPISCQTRRRLSDDLESRVNALWGCVTPVFEFGTDTHVYAIESKRRLEY